MWCADEPLGQPTPSPLKREQVENLCDDIRDMGHMSVRAQMLRDHDAALRLTITQLQATLTAREARITALESAMREAFPMLNNTSDDDTDLKERLRMLLNLHEE